MPDDGSNRGAIWGGITLAIALVATIVHFWAGYVDAREFVWRPLGHLSLLALFAWCISLAFALLILVAVSRRSRSAQLAAAISLIGIALLLSESLKWTY